MKLTFYARVKIKGKVRRVVVEEKKVGGYQEVKGAMYYEIRRRGQKPQWENIGPDFEGVEGARDRFINAARDEKLRENKSPSAPEPPSPGEAKPASDGTIKKAVGKYLFDKKGQKPKTVAQYTTALHQFLDYSASKRATQLSQINNELLIGFKDHLFGDDYGKKTVRTRMNIVNSVLRQENVTARAKTPKPDENPPVPYDDDVMEKLFDEMTPDELVQFKFFLGTGGREQEVQYASWPDINLTTGEYTVRAKEDVGFTVKNHLSRTIVFDDSLVALLRDYKRRAPHSRWLFVGKRDKQPQGHMLRMLKEIALRAKLNCGHCKTKIKGKPVSCATDPVCTHFKLHRFRKTCATRWQADDVKVNDIRVLLGHESLATTQKYLGLSDKKTIRDKINRAAAKRNAGLQLIPERAVGD